MVLNTKTNTWVLSAGHEVTYVTETHYTMQAGRQHNYAKTTYTCTCGQKTEHYGAAKKTTLDSHDTWNAPKRSVAFLAMLAKNN